MKKKNMIFRFFIQHKFSYLVGILFMFLSAWIQTLFPTVLGEAIDTLESLNFTQQMMIHYILIIIGIGVGTFICTYIWRNLIIRNARTLECRLRESLFIHLQKLSPSFYKEHKTGDLIAYAINDISAVRMAFGPATAMSINGICLCLASIYSMSQSIDWRLTLMCLFPIPIILVVMLKLGKVIQIRFRYVQELFAKISDRVQENIYGIRVIKSYVQESAEIEKFEQLNNEMLEANMKMVQVSLLLSPTIELCFSISFILNLLIGGNMVLKGDITLGDFVAFNTYLTMIMNPVISIGRIINIIQRGLASYQRLNEIFEVEPEIEANEAGLTHPFSGKIVIHDVSFTYPHAKQPALSHINLSIKAGEHLGIVGKTGSGKTTLVNLLLKLYPLTNGEIYFDNYSLNEYSLSHLRNQISYVPQDHFLFSATIAQNLSFFKSGYTQQDYDNATTISCLNETILNLPNQYQTILGERGVNLSGGQKQRLSIARAIIRQPSILILDDSLSAVDAITEQKLLSNFKALNQTMIIISHKLSSVKSCDKIIVLEEGKVREEGTHESLMSRKGVYYEMYQEQSNHQDG
ncbi:MAG: ABC transporter ATP-binding protein [Turicibacter sp.]|nr:ABC transporter ATP-binding protein [Turicibacter sp.]